MSILAGAKVDATDFDLPDPADFYGNGTNTITATSFTDLPTTACTGSITNPHPTAGMLCIVNFGAWISIATSAPAVRMCPRVSGATTVSAGIGTFVPGWGFVPRATNSGGSTYDQYMGYGRYVLAPGSNTFTMQAYRESASGTVQVNYPVISVVPIRYV